MTQGCMLGHTNIHTCLEDLFISMESEWINLQTQHKYVLCFHVKCSFGECCHKHFAPLSQFLWAVLSLENKEKVTV